MKSFTARIIEKPEPLRYSTQIVREEDVEDVVSALRSPWLTQGPVLQEFEEALAAYTGAKYCVCVTSGTVALELAYRAANVYTVITSPLTFMATANAALVACGEDVGTLGFVDVDENGNAEKWPSKTRYEFRVALAPVHFAGRAAKIPDYPIVIEDACHALGAMDYDGCSRVGSCAHSLASVFSFHPTKPITTGEGGAITTNDEGFARELRSLRNHGRDENGLMVRLGTNARMTELQAALGLSQLKRCDAMLRTRLHLVGLYELLLESVPVKNPSFLTASSHAWHLYPIRVKNGRRDEILAKLQAQGIGAQKHYHPIVPLHPYYRQRYGYQDGDFPNAEAFAAEEISLPLHAGMVESDVVRVVDALREALA